LAAGDTECVIVVNGNIYFDLVFRPLCFQLNVVSGFSSSGNLTTIMFIPFFFVEELDSHK